jgi:hypothetical protein
MQIFTRFFGGRKRTENNSVENENASAEKESPVSSCSLPESKRERKFNSNWLQKYKRLRHENDNIFFSAKNATNSFTEGCTNCKNTTLTCHKDTKMHMNSVRNNLNLRSYFATAQRIVTKKYASESGGKF